MFVGHYGVSFAAKKAEPSIPLWVLFIAVQLLDVLWAPFVLLGLEKVRIVPGITASNPLDLYYMPYTHSLVAAIGWSVLAALVYRVAAPSGNKRAATVIGGAVFSHWVLDLLVHRPDLPLYDNTAKVGLGLWNVPAIAIGLEAVLLFGVIMLAIQAYVFFGPPPASDKVAAATAMIAYAVFAVVIRALERRAVP